MSSWWKQSKMPAPLDGRESGVDGRRKGQRGGGWRPFQECEEPTGGSVGKPNV